MIVLFISHKVSLVPEAIFILPCNKNSQLVCNKYVEQLNTYVGLQFMNMYVANGSI